MLSSRIVDLAILKREKRGASGHIAHAGRKKEKKEETLTRGECFPTAGGKSHRYSSAGHLRKGGRQGKAILGVMPRVCYWRGECPSKLLWEKKTKKKKKKKKEEKGACAPVRSGPQKGGGRCRDDSTRWTRGEIILRYSHCGGSFLLKRKRKGAAPAHPTRAYPVNPQSGIRLILFRIGLL